MDKMVKYLNRWVNKAFKVHYQRTKPSPYIKKIVERRLYNTKKVIHILKEQEYCNTETKKE